ncbi:MAG: pilus assembly protein [Pseudomonadota bacterium]
MWSWVVTGVRAFRKDEQGTVAVIFALVAIILLVVGGLALDTGRAYVARARISAALDAAALAAAKGLRLQNLDNDEVLSLAQRVFNANMQGNVGSTQASTTQLGVEIDRASAGVTLNVDAAIPTTLGRVIGIRETQLNNVSEAKYGSGDLEVAIQLDVTGSMFGSKMVALKDATKRLIDTLIPDQDTGDGKVRIALAPFSGGVNAGHYAYDVSGQSSPCVYERLDPSYQATDLPPIGAQRLATKSEVGGQHVCPTLAPVLPLTDDKLLLETTLESYRAGGATAGHLGAAWSWYMLSPKWSSVWPSSSRPEPYDDGRTTKVAVLMTDGQYNTYHAKSSNVHSNGESLLKSVAAAKDTCDEMKKKGIIIYTVGFQLNLERAKEVMEYCASGSNRSFSADSDSELLMTFHSIAVSIAQLRLTR